MVRKQLSKMNSSEFKGDEYKCQAGEKRIIKKSLPRESVSPSSFKPCSTGSQNLFERFEMEAMDGCAKSKGSSPICKATADTGRSNEEQDVMIAFRALRGQLKGKACKGCSDSESSNGPSRNMSPGSASPRGRHSPRAHVSSVGLHSDCLMHHSSMPNNVNGPAFPQHLRSFSSGSSSSSLSNINHASRSPKRMSPRKHGDRLGLTKLRDAEKLKTGSSSGAVSEVDHRHLCSHSLRAWSAREVPPVSVQEANSPRSLRSRFDLNHPPISETCAKTYKINPNSGKTKIAAISKISHLQNSKNCVSNKNKTIKRGEARKYGDHVVCSLNKCSKVAHVDTLTVPVVRQLFIDTETCNLNSPGFKQPNHSSTPLRDNPKEYETDVSMGSERNLLREDGESLLCAMLVGGVEVTKHYEQSRDSQSGGSKSNSCSCDRSKCANSESSNSAFNESHDSFFDEDLSLSEISEIKPYELPVLSRLPALKNVNMAVLELTKAETRFSEDSLSEVKKLKGHNKKQQPLLDLILRVKSCVSPSDSSCKEADEVLLNVSKDEDELDHRVVNMLTFVDSKSHLQTSGPSPLEDSNIDMHGNYDVSRDPIEVVKSGNLKTAQEINYEMDCAVKTSVSENISTSAVAAKAEGESVLDSPCSLGELDTAQMTEAATQAVKNVLSSNVNGKKGKDNVLCQFFSSVGSTSMCPTTSDNLCPSTSKYFFPSTSTPARSTCSDGFIKTTSQFRTFFNRISSPSKVCWKPKADTSTELNRPRWSKWHSAMEPLPLNILGQFENADCSKWSPFTSRELDSYLKQSGNRHLKPACKDSQLARFLVDEGFVKSFDELQRQLTGNSELKKVIEEGKAVKSEEEEEGEEDEKDLELARKLDPDFDEVEGLVFVSFPSELGILAHEKVEKELQWDKEVSASVHMARFHAFEELRRREGKVRRESQGLRGQHMKWRKYQRLYRLQLQQLYRDQKKDIPSPLEKLSEKTTDSHKAKIVKKKLSLGAVAEDVALELLGEGHERVKRKRKTYVFSSKRKKTKVVVKQEKELFEERNSEAEEEDDDEEGYGAPIPLEEDAYMEDVQCSLQEMRLKEKGLKQSRGIFARLNMGPEERHIFKKLGGWVTRYRRFRKLPPGTKPSKSHRIRSKGRTLKAAFEIKTLNAGLVLRALTTLVGEYKSDTFYFNKNVTKVELPDNVIPSPSTTITPFDESRAPYQHCISLPSATAILTVPASITSASERGLQPSLALAAERSVKVDSGIQVKTEMDGLLVELASESRPNTKCDKPGCRFGCICHLCLPPADMDINETELPVASTPVKHGCDKEYCTLGCICDSLESPARAETASNSITACADSKSCEDRKTSSDPSDALSLSRCVPSCFHRCVSQSASVKESPVSSVEDSQLLESDITKAEGSLQSPVLSEDGEEHGDSSGDECPTLEKTAPRKQRNVDRYSNLPRRQTSYRIAKNLDAVSRKAMMMWEMSEVYSEQMNNRRKKIPDNAGVTFSCSPTTLSPMILSSTSVAVPVSQGNTKMVSTSVSVNTLPFLSLKKPCASGMERPASARLHGLHSCVQKPSSVVLSDEEGSADADIEKLSLGCVAQTKKMRVTESERDVAAKKMRLSQLSVSLPLMTSANTSTTATTTIVSASSVAILDVTASTANVCGPVTAVSTKVPATSVTTGSGRVMKPVLTLHTSSSSEVLSSDSGSEWQISLICLKANSSHRHNPSVGDSDDVLEEDEIKLFEFYANCQWERSKKEILMAITNTLKRGLYPEPQVLWVGDFRVEILPKASRPSVIPVELRSKLPNYMYSVRVRVTEIVPTPKMACSTPAVTAISALSGAPALIKGAGSDLLKIVDRLARVKEGRAHLEEGMNSTAVETSSSSTVPQMAAVATNKFPAYMSSASKAGYATKSDKGMTSSVGISGLGKLHISQSSQSVLPACSSMQHLQILQKDRTQLGSETKKKKKKKKKKKNLEVGDDFLVPSLSNLTVSPRKINKNSATSFPLQLNSSTVSSFCPSHTEAGSSPDKPSIAVSVSSTMTRSLAVANVTMTAAQKITMVSGSPPLSGISGVPGTLNKAGTDAASGPLLAATSSACGPQLASTAAGSSRQASNVSSLTRLSLPGAVRLPPNVKLPPGVQVIPARMMAFRPPGTDSHKQFYCIPLPMASLSPALQTHKKVSGISGDKKYTNTVPLILSQTPPRKGLGTSQAVSNVVIDKPDGKSETVTLETLKDQAVKKKKKKKKKKPLECCIDDDRGDCKVIKQSAAVIGDYCKILDSSVTPSVDIRVPEPSAGYIGDLNVIGLSCDSKCASNAKAKYGSVLSCKPVTLVSPLPASVLSPSSAISLQVMAVSCSGQITNTSTVTSQASTPAVLLSADSTTASVAENKGGVSAAQQSNSDLISVSE